MSNYMYRHLPEIMEQRAARLSGLSFLTVWQFLACAGVGAVGTGLKMPIPVVVILVLLAYGALFVWRGEFIFSRLWAILRTAARVRARRPATINLDRAWDGMQKRKAAGAAVIYRRPSGGGVIAMTTDRKK